MNDRSQPTVVFVADSHFHLHPDPTEAHRVARFVELHPVAWYLASLADLRETHSADDLKRLLGHEIDRSRERVFMLLSLLYERRLGADRGSN